MFVEDCVGELGVYFKESFGNKTRIDYGSGHELNFTVFLLCLFQLDFFSQNDFQAVVTRVFADYIALCQKLQLVYNLEPAGSQGVWGLDDFQFLVYYFGSAQLIVHPSILPISIHEKDVLDSYSNQFV